MTGVKKHDFSCSRVDDSPQFFNELNGIWDSMVSGGLFGSFAQR
jgi:hypothetical protein